MTKMSLAFQSALSDPDNPIRHLDSAVARTSKSEATSQLNTQVLCKTFLAPFEINVISKAGEVVSTVRVQGPRRQGPNAAAGFVTTMVVKRHLFG